MLLPRPLRGIVPPLITPLLDRNTLDVQGLERLIEHVLAGGVHALFLLGTTGEGPSLSFRLRNELIERACRQAAHRVPVLVGITDTCLVESLRLARLAAQAGAQAVVYAGPCYFPVSQEELLAHVGRLAADSPLPLFLYNMPSHTGVNFEADMVREAACIPNIAGLKDSSGNLRYFQELCRQLAIRPDFTLLTGPEELLGAAMLAGGHGGVTGGANLFPELYVRLYEAARAGEIEEMLRLQNRVLEIGARLYRVGQGASSYLRGLKCALSLMGICGDFMADPYVPFGPADRQEVAKGIEELGLRPHSPEGGASAARAPAAGSAEPRSVPGS